MSARALGSAAGLVIYLVLTSGARLGSGSCDGGAWGAPKPPDEERLDERLLRQAGVPRDLKGLARFIRNYMWEGDEPRDLDHLISQLGADDFQAREKATAKLIDLGPITLLALKPAHKRSRDAEIRKRAGHCIEQILRRQKLVPFAMGLAIRKQPVEACRTFLKFKEAGIRKLCLMTLPKPPPREVIPALLAALGDPDQGVRAEVHAALLYVVGPDELPELLRLARKGNPLTRVGAIQLFWRYKDEPKKVVPVLLQAVRDDDPRVRWMAVHALAHFGSAEGVVPALIEALNDKGFRRKDKEPIAENAAYTLGHLGAHGKPAIPTLIKIIKGERPGPRGAAITGLGNMGQRDKSAAAVVVPALVSVLEDASQSKGTRAAAVRALGWVGPGAKAAVPALEKASQNGDEVMRTSVLDALRRINR